MSAWLAAYWPLWLSLVLFALASIGTPGPNNIMLTASGANFGLRRTIPHIFGIASGFVFMLVVVALVQRRLVAWLPLMNLVLGGISLVVVVWLAYKIATASPSTAVATAAPGTKQPKPLNLLQAAAFQWINPKAWLIQLVVVNQYISPELNFFTQLLVCACTFWLVTVLLTPWWAIGGKLIARWLTRPSRLRIFNIIMAILLIISIVPGYLGW